MLRIIGGAILFTAALIIQDYNHSVCLMLFIAAYLLVGADILYKASRNIFRGRVFDENFLMTIATLGAFAVSHYTEAVAVMLFYQIGEVFQMYAVSKSRKSIADLMDIRPDYANLQDGNELLRVDPEDVRIGDIIVVKPGERIPLDGVVIQGESSLDTSALTGESIPRDVYTGGEVLSGCINISGLLTVRVEKEFGESTASRILDLVENASCMKSKSENFITKFARVYTPLVVIIALAMAVLPPLLAGAEFSDWVYRALTFLVVSCPCALVISIPLSFFGGIGGASRMGILIKGGNYLEALAKADTIVFDKTGTMTKGVFEVQETHPAENISDEQLLYMAAHAEVYSQHPIAQSLKRAYGREIDISQVSCTKELSGEGIVSSVSGHSVAAGNSKLMHRLGIDISDMDAASTVIHVATDGVYSGYLIIADELKTDAVDAVRRLRECGIKKTIMLTGDADKVGREIAYKLGIDQVYTELFPEDKVHLAEKIMNASGGKLVFVGDGINDAPVLARADVGIAMGGIGSDAAIEAADIVIMDDKPSKIADAISTSKKTLKVVYENIILALGIKIFVLSAAAVGYAGMWEAIFADVGVSIIAILNSFRLLAVKREWNLPVQMPQSSAEPE